MRRVSAERSEGPPVVRGSRLGNNGRFVASRPGEEAETLVSGRFSVTDEADYFRMADQNEPAGAGDGFRVRLVFKTLIQPQE